MRYLPTYVRSDNFSGLPSLNIKKGLAYYLDRFIFQDQKSADFVEDGTREHYYFFLLGYLVPLVYAQSQWKFRKFQVLDCGPLMNPILEETLNRMGFKYAMVKPSEVKRPIFLRHWTYYKGNPFRLKQSIQMIKNVWADYKCIGIGCGCEENIIIVRSPPHNFYYTDLHPNYRGYGTGRRTVTNWPEVSDYLSSLGIKHSLYEPGAHSLGCQIQAFKGAKRIIGIRGAEWANVIWCQPGLEVRMIDPFPPATLQINLFELFNFNCEFDYPDNFRPEVNPETVLNFFLKS
jgi:hypothetical protein